MTHSTKNEAEKWEMSKQERQQLTGHPSPSLLLYSESGAEIYLGDFPVAPHAAPLATSPTRSSAHEPAWVRGLSSPWPSAVLGLCRASSLCRLHRLSTSRSNVSSEQNMASRISSSVVNKIVSPKCSGADRGTGKTEESAHPTSQRGADWEPKSINLWARKIPTH